MRPDPAPAVNRALTYVGLAATILLVAPLLYVYPWQSDPTAHVFLETAATTVALVIGAVGLLRYYARRSGLYLFVGSGFLGAALLDGYHAWIVARILGGDPSGAGLPAWSWLDAKTFLAAMLWLGALPWATGARIPAATRERLIYAGAGAIALASFLTYAWVPIPPVDLPGVFVNRPGELIPAVLFALALHAHVTRGHWRGDVFVHALVIALMLNLMAQLLFMPYSTRLFDAMFSVGHTLKHISYLVVLVGLLASILALYRQIDDSRAALRRSNEALRASEARAHAVIENIVDGVITIDPTGAIESVNPAAEEMFGWPLDSLVGRRVEVLMTTPDAEHHARHLDRYLDTREARILGERREVVGRRRDGTAFPMELAVSELRTGGEHLFVGIARDITRQREMERIKAEFVSVVSHELRTPLTSIHGALELLADGTAGELPEEAATLVGIARQNGERLVRLVSDILDIEKIEAGEMSFETRPLAMGPLVEEALEVNHGYADRHAVRLVLEEPMPEAWVIADPDRLLQVLDNLLSNAAKFSPPGDAVEVRIERGDGKVRVAITDHGPGIPDGFRARIFERFAQADASNRRSQGGTGLGLSIVKAIVERLHGEVGFDSTPGVATTFHFSLPAVSPPGDGAGNPARGA